MVPILSDGLAYKLYWWYITDAEEITLLEPLGVAHNGVERLEVRGEDVLVIGCGPVGLLAQCLAKALGAKR